MINLKKKLITTIIWDFDGTLYDPSEIIEPLRNVYFNIYKKKINNELTLEKFENETKKSGSWSALVSKKIGISEKILTDIIDKKFPKHKYIQKNLSLVNKIESLTQYRHIILSNSNTKEVSSCLNKIGFKNKEKKGFYPFSNIIGRDQYLHMKPEPDGFKLVQRITRHPMICHLSIGDSFHHDLEPAKKLGMQELHISEIDSYFNFSSDTKKNVWEKNTEKYSSLITEDPSFFASTYYNLLVKPIINLIKKYINKNAKNNLLDLGCGEGYLSREIYKKFPNVGIIGVDFSNQLLQEAKLKNSKIKYLNANLESPTVSLKKNSFSIIVSNLVIIYIKNINNYWKNISSLLMKNGTAIVSLPHPCFNQENNNEWFANNKTSEPLIIENYNLEKKFDKTIVDFKTHHYHRKLETYVQTAKKNNLEIIEIIEPEPQNKTNSELMKKAERVPFYLIFVLRKNTN